MEDRTALMQYNYVEVSEEEIKRYETSKLSDEVLNKIKKKARSICVKANIEEAFEKVKVQFEDNEVVKHVFWEFIYMHYAFMVPAGYSLVGGITFLENPVRAGVILTNKGVFVIVANKDYYALKIKKFRFNDIDYIESKTMNRRLVKFTIKPIKSQEIKLEIRSGNNHIKFIDYVRKNNINLDIRITKNGIKDNIKTVIAVIFIILFFIISLLSAYNVYISQMQK